MATKHDEILAETLRKRQANNMFEGVTEKVVDSVLRTKFEDLSQEAVDKTKLVLLDSVGCALGSCVVDRARIALQLAQEFGGNPQASIIGSQRTSYALAAFVNGELINALDYDILGPLTGHVCPFVTPSCLATAEKVRASGKELITAIALAHEIGGRVAASIAQIKVPKDEPPYYENSARFSYACTIFGGVAGAGKLLGLDEGKMANAFGIAGASVPVPAGVKWHHMNGPAIMVKYGAWAGWVAQLATVAALFAEKGFTGDTTILDGEWGYWQIVGSPFFNVANLLGGLGEVWHIQEAAFKPYPVCQCNHAGIEGINSIVKEQGIRPEEVEEILIKGDPLLQTSNRMTTEVESFADIQFSNVNIFALAAIYGDKPSPAWQTPRIYNDQRIKALARKVKIETHPRTEEIISGKIKMGKFPVFQDTIVEITARGRRFCTEITAPKGTPLNPMTGTELVEKFRINASYSALRSSRVEEIIKIISELEQLDDVTKLIELLTVP